MDGTKSREILEEKLSVCFRLETGVEVHLTGKQ